MVNLPWWLFFAAFWALLWRPRTTAGMVTAGALCFLAIASEPLVALFVPLALVRALALRPLREHAATAGLVLGLVYQGVARLVSGGKAFTPAALHGIGQDYAERAGLSLFAGMRGADWLMSHSATAAIVIGSVIAGAVVAAGLAARSREVRSFTVAATVCSVVCFVVPIWLRGVSALLETSALAEGSRYQAVPLLLLISVVMVVAGHLARPGPAGAAVAPGVPVPGGPAPPGRRSGRKGTAVIVACAAAFLPTWVADFRDANTRSVGPAWPSQIEPAVARCRTSHNRSVAVVIDPHGWTAVLPCAALK
jgi:hypothetical protein